MVSPLCSRQRVWIASQAVSVASGSRAAAAWSSDSGFAAAVRASIVTRSACAPLRNTLGIAYTASPVLKAVTPCPTPTTTPDTSKPGMIGSCRGARNLPERIL